MIVLETSPEMARVQTSLPLDMSTQAAEDGWERMIVRTKPEGELLGTARQAPNSGHIVRFFQGKGGFCVVVSNDELVYFGLPGSRIVLADTEVELPGALIAGKPEGMLTPTSHMPMQTVSPQAMILGAGLATRFEPISGDTTGYAKPAVPLVGDDSVVTTIAKHLRRHGFSRILINTFYKPAGLKQQLQTVSNVDVAYIDEDAPSGTAGGLVKALQQGLVDGSKPIFIIQGDAITDADLSLLMRMHAERGAAVTIGGQIVPDTDVNKFGIIETDGSGGDGQSGNITSFKEKPALEEAGHSRFANAGFYILAPEVFELFLAGGQQKLARAQLYDYAQDFFPAVLAATQAQSIRSQQAGKPMGFWAQAVGGYWSDMGNPAQYIEAVRDAYAGRLEMDLPANLTEYYEKDVIYWPGTKALAQHEQAQLSGNVIVAKAR